METGGVAGEFTGLPRVRHPVPPCCSMNLTICRVRARAAFGNAAEACFGSGRPPWIRARRCSR